MYTGRKRVRSSSQAVSASQSSQKSTSSKSSKKSLSKPKFYRSLGKGFPERMMMTHVYCDPFDLTSSSGALNTYTFSCNGLYDPNISAAGHQPLFFDQMAAIYNHYVVVGSKITIKVLAPGNGRVCLIRDDNNSTSGFSSIGSAAEQTNAGPIYNLRTGDSETVLTSTWSLKKVFGAGPSDQTYQGTAGANPTEQSYWMLHWQSDGAATLALMCTATIEYTAIWVELKDTTPS